MVNAKGLQVCAEMNEAAPAIVTDAAGNIRIDGGTLAGPYSVNGNPDILNNTGELMTEHNRGSRT
jgi:hypothetical protein